MTAAATPPIPPGGSARAIAVVAAAAAVMLGLALPSRLDAGSLYLYSAGIADGVAVLSIVLLTGLAGQVSLAQAAFMGVGALTAAHLATDAHWPVLLAMVAGGLAAVPVGMLAAVPALRVGGVHLAVVTLAYGQLLQHAVFEAPVNGGSGDGVPLPRPGGFVTDAAFCRLEVVVLALVGAMVLALGRRRTGRNLALLRHSETAARAVGLDVVRVKVAVFALSGFIAGLAGALSAGVSGVATPSSYGPFDSVGLLAVAVIGGVASVPGAVAAGMLRACGQTWVAHLPLRAAPPDLASAVFGVALVVTLVLRPAGLVAAAGSAGRRARAAARRAVHERPVPLQISEEA